MANEPVTEKVLTAGAIAKLEKEMKFKPFANDAEITLTLAIVRNMLASPTSQGKMPDDNACMRYMMMAKSRALNPFEGDCFLLGFDTQDGPKFEMITAHQAFLKRAEIHPDFDGMESGVIVMDKESKQLLELQGDFHLDSQELVGGWAKVHHKGKKIPTYRRVKLATFRKPFGRWKIDPAGMIVKCAEADSLRSAFPTKLGGLYLREEIELAPANVTVQTAPPAFDMPATAAPQLLPTNGAKPPADAPQSNQDESQTGDPAVVLPSAGKTTEEVVRALQEAMRQHDVSEDQLTAYCRISKLATPKQEVFQLADAKLRMLLDEFEQRLPDIRDTLI